MGLVFLLLGDVFFTVLHPQAHGGPVNRVLMRGIWRGFRMVARFLRGEARDRFLSLGAPVLSAAVLFAWAALLVTGFALVYAAFPAAFTHTQWVSPIGWAEAFYFSGVAASTLGMGDVLVEPGWLRGLAVLEGLLGFMLISISAAYILAIYSAQGDASSFALEVWGAIGVDPEEGIERLLGDLDSADAWADATARRLAHITTDHARYPILHYFRPPDRRQAMVPQAGTLLRLFRRLDGRPGWEAGHPSLVMLHNALGRYLVEVSRRFARRTGVDIDPDDEQNRLDRHRQALEHLAYREEDAI
jgi:Ion channel